MAASMQTDTPESQRSFWTPVRFVAIPIMAAGLAFLMVMGHSGLSAAIAALFVGVTMLVGGTRRQSIIARAPDFEKVCRHCLQPLPAGPAEGCAACGWRPGFSASRPRTHHGTVVLTDCASEAEAAAVVSSLRDAGIPAEVAGGGLAHLRADFVANAQVVVLAKDAPEATRVLDEVRRAAASIDWSQVDVGEPESANDEPTS